jgi:capsular exopolysaccharide synthesis family protein
MPDRFESGPGASGPPGQPAAGGSPRSYGYGGHYGGYGSESYTGYGDTAGVGQLHLMDYVRKVYRHRWLAVTAFAVVLVGAAVSTFSTVPVYEARVQLMLEPETPNVMSFKEGMDQGYGYGYEEYYYQTQYSILKSRGLARRTIDALNLWDELGGGVPKPSQKAPFSLTGSIRGAVKSAIGVFYSSPENVSTPKADETVRQTRAIDAFLGNVTVAPVRNSRLVTVRYASSKPELAAHVANGLAREYIAQNLEFKFLSTKEAAEWLTQQLAQERKKLEESELALQRYREKGDAVALEDRQNIVVQRLTDLNAAYTKARTDRIEKEALYNQLNNLRNDSAALDTFPAILSNSFIQQLKAQLADLQRQQAQLADRLGEKHPEMIKQRSAIESTEAKLTAEIAKVVQSVRNEFTAAEAQERSLAAALNAQKADALALNQRGIEYSVLRREAESSKQIYDALMQRAKETGISGELKRNNIRLVDQAEIPRSAVSPNRTRDLALGLLGGLLAGIGLALFVEYLDNRVKNPDEIKGFLGMSFLGLIPGLRERDLSPGQPPMLTESVPQNFAEAVRTVRTNVIFSSAEQGARSVLVTSTQPQEGKTVVTANLAVALAQTGQRVLLMDADMRKPRQHEMFNLTQDPGLSSLLVGRAKANAAIRKADVQNLWVMPAGPNPPNPAELLGSSRFRDLLKALLGHFDWIVIDSPPVMAVTDASVIGHLTKGVVFVIGSEQVARGTVRAAIEQLQAAKCTLLGGVLNRVNLRKNPYYYAHYYKHDYAGYYGAEAGAGK